jgi:serine phosphatase RsbU (regulator of sigma subunit)
MERLGENQIGREYQRSSDRSSLLDRHLTRDIGLQQDPINTMHSTLTGGLLNPVGAQSFAPQASSGSASLLSSLGNSAAGFGSYLTGRNMQMDLLRQLLGQP